MKHINASIREIVTLTKKLITFESIADRLLELQGVIKYCAAFMRSQGFIVKTYSQNSKPSLVALSEPTHKPNILFSGHLDVVPADKKDFLPKVERGRIYGRGAADMKGADAVMMIVMRELFRKYKKQKSIGLMLTTDEEIGGADGVRYLIEERGYRPAVVCVPDGASGFELKEAQKGIIHFELTAQGKGAHGSRPWLGESAVDELIEAYEKLKAQFPDPTGEEDWKPSINLGRISGGEATNKVPEKAQAWFDFRYTETKKSQEWLQVLKKVVQAPGISFKLDRHGHACYTNYKNPYIQSFLGIAEGVLGKKVLISRQSGASDGRFFSARGIPVILFEPMGGNVHSKDEWVNINSLEGLYQIFYSFAEQTG